MALIAAARLRLRWLWCYLRYEHSGWGIRSEGLNVICARCGCPQMSDMQTRLMAKHRQHLKDG